MNIKNFRQYANIIIVIKADVKHFTNIYKKK